MRAAFSGGLMGSRQGATQTNSMNAGMIGAGQSRGTLPVAFGYEDGTISGENNTVSDALSVMRDAQEQQMRMGRLLNRSAIIQGVMKSFQKVVDNLSRGS
jgi:hypothetical protein